MNNKKKILFRADANYGIGSGDLISLINLSEYFAPEYECFFIAKKYPSAVNIFSVRGMKDNAVLIDPKIEFTDEITFIDNFIEEKKIGIIVLEITERKLNEYDRLESTVKRISIDFYGYPLRESSIVLNWMPNAEDLYDFSSFPQTQFFLGPEYVILSKAFLDVPRGEIERKYVLVAMGGNDERNLTMKVVRLLMQIGVPDIKVIIGPGYKWKQELISILPAKIEVKENVIDMLSEYLSAKVVISTGGLISSEVVFTNTPLVVIATYPHQIARCKFFQSIGVARYIGYIDFDERALADSVLNYSDIFSGRNILKPKILEFIKAVKEIV
ncbi:MAG: hypothetical protein DRP84_08890 [Spirochaetes bacterium]|nr:MAG: hypothetical protein DRP84_08890 [Spirochaetota bacterium]